MIYKKNYYVLFQQDQAVQELKIKIYLNSQIKL